MSILGLTEEDLELCEGYEHYALIAVYPNKYASLLILKNNLSDKICAMDVYLSGRACSGYSLVCRPKKQKKTFIKTLKELVDSGWDTEIVYGDVYLSHARSNQRFHTDMLKFCGHERIYYKQTEQSRWAWTPEMLIEKEV